MKNSSALRLGQRQLWSGVALGFGIAITALVIVLLSIKTAVGASPPAAAQAPVAAAAIVLMGTLAIGMLTALITYFGHLVSKQNAILTAETAKLQASLVDKNASAANIIARENAVLSATLAVNSKLADLRQAWINNLRNDMADYQGRGVSGDDAQKKADYYKCMTRIELSLNPDDEHYRELHDTLYAYISGDRDRDWDHWDDRYVRVCQKILKSEWDVLKGDLKGVVSDEVLELQAAKSLVKSGSVQNPA